MISKWPRVIYLETSVLRALPIDIANAEFQELVEMCLPRHIKITVPELALNELLHARKSSLHNSIRDLNKIVNGSMFKFSRPGINWPMDQKGMTQKLEDEIRLILKKYSVGIIKTPKLNMNEILEMAVKKAPPFEEKGEKGFRDTVILFTIIRYAKRHNKDGLNLVVTKDRIFTEDEVTKRFESEGLEFEIKDSIDGALIDLRKLLDEEEAKIREKRSRILGIFLEQNRKIIESYLGEKILLGQILPSAFAGRPLITDSRESVELVSFVKFTSLTPGILRKRETEGEVKISFSALFNITLNVAEPAYPRPITYTIFDSSTVVPGTSTDVSSADVNVASPGSDYLYYTPAYYQIMTKMGRAEILFEASVHLRKTLQEETYSDLHIDRAIPQSFNILEMGPLIDFSS